MKSAELRHLEKDDWVYGTDVQADSKNTITIIGAISIVRLWQLEKTCIIWMETKSWRRITQNIREPRKNDLWTVAWMGLLFRIVELQRQAGL